MTLKVYQAFVSDFITQAFGLPIAHENDDYTPTKGTAWVQLRVFLNAIERVGLSDTDDITGAYQFTLHYPLGEGAIPARTQAEAIFAAYPNRRRFTYSGQQVEITGSELFSAAPDDGWYQVVGRIYFRAFV